MENPPPKPLKIGPITLSGCVLPAPMSGVTDPPFRNLMAEVGGVPCTISEMIASESMVRQTRQSRQKVQRTRATQPVVSIVQLAGVKPQVMADAARLAVDEGAEVIDINMGCPAKKVVGCAAGSALMKDLPHARLILEAVVAAVSVPVTLKMRKGWDDETQNAPALARIAEDVGIQMLTIHGRTRCQFYRGSADWAFFTKLKEVVSLPVVGNGDITTPAMAQQVMQTTGVDGVMIGRGCYGKPWLPSAVQTFLSEGRFCADPSGAEKKSIVLRHLDAMLSFYGCEHGVRVARKHLAWYSKGYHDGAVFRAAVNQTEDAGALLSLVRGFFDAQCAAAA